MRDINRSWTPLNEYTRPIEGVPDYRVSGIIKAIDENQEKISVGRIDYERFFNEEFQYIITPFWNIIDYLPVSIFQGIPGIDMELRLEKYYRVNYEPVFITQRTPPRNREDLSELLSSVDMDYYEKLEWLIRTELLAGDDNLIVERARDDIKTFSFNFNRELREAMNELQYEDVVNIESLDVLGRKPSQITSTLTRLMYYGVRIQSKKEGLDITSENYREIIPLFTALNQAYNDEHRKQRKSGINAAKDRKVYRGRKKTIVDEALLREVYGNFKSGKVSLEEAMNISGVNSKATFYRRVKDLNN